MLKEAKINHRVQKLLVIYMMKDNETFNSMLVLSQLDIFALKLVCHAKMTLTNLRNNRYCGSYTMEVLGENLWQNFDLFNMDSFLSVTIEKWELDGYIKMLNNYLVSEKIEALDDTVKKSVDNVLDNIDWSNLITATA